MPIALTRCGSITVRVSGMLPSSIHLHAHLARSKVDANIVIYVGTCMHVGDV
jgi:Rieske Fe-S protein